MPLLENSAPEADLNYDSSDLYVYVGGERCSDMTTLPRYLAKRSLNIGDCFADPSQDWTKKRGFAQAPAGVVPVVVGAKARQSNEPAESQHLRRALKQLQAELNNLQSTCRGLAEERDGLSRKLTNANKLLAGFNMSADPQGDGLLKTVAALDAMPFAESRAYAKQYGVTARSEADLLTKWQEYLDAQAGV